MWKLMNNHVLCDSNLKIGGCSFPSMCSICTYYKDSTMHIFFTYKFSTNLWKWFSGLKSTNFSPSNPADLWNLVDSSWSPLWSLVVNAVIVNVINVIWLYQNHSNFKYVKPSLAAAKAWILTSFSISSNATILASCL